MRHSILNSLSLLSLLFVAGSALAAPPADRRPGSRKDDLRHTCPVLLPVRQFRNNKDVVSRERR
jgi:hypothetical protein